MLVLIVVLGLAVLIGAISRFSENQDGRKRGLRPAPWSDMSPGMRSLLSAHNGLRIHSPGDRRQGPAPIKDDGAEQERLGSR